MKASSRALPRPALPHHAGVASNQLFPFDAAIIDLITKHKAQALALVLPADGNTRYHWTLGCKVDAGLKCTVLKVGTDKRSASVAKQIAYAPQG